MNAKDILKYGQGTVYQTIEGFPESAWEKGGACGIWSVKDILAHYDVPVIFITAFPERLLTGERPEPTFLITKPFQPETVKAAIGQALFFHPARAKEAA